MESNQFPIAQNGDIYWWGEANGLSEKEMKQISRILWNLGGECEDIGFYLKNENKLPSSVNFLKHNYGDFTVNLADGRILRMVNVWQPRLFNSKKEEEAEREQVYRVNKNPTLVHYME